MNNVDLTSCFAEHYKTLPNLFLAHPNHKIKSITFVKGRFTSVKGSDTVVPKCQPVADDYLGLSYCAAFYFVEENDTSYHIPFRYVVDLIMMRSDLQNSIIRRTKWNPDFDITNDLIDIDRIDVFINLALHMEKLL